jgi:hypothetical protein
MRYYDLAHNHTQGFPYYNVTDQIFYDKFDREVKRFQYRSGGSAQEIWKKYGGTFNVALGEPQFANLPRPDMAAEDVRPHFTVISGDLKRILEPLYSDFLEFFPLTCDFCEVYWMHVTNCVDALKHEYIFDHMQNAFGVGAELEGKIKAGNEVKVPVYDYEKIKNLPVFFMPYQAGHISHLHCNEEFLRVLRDSGLHIDMNVARLWNSDNPLWQTDGPEERFGNFSDEQWIRIIGEYRQKLSEKLARDSK